MARDMPGWMSLLPPRWRNEIDKDTARAIAGEFVGTFLFVFLATTGTRTALAVGVAYTVASYSVAALSGGHLNPLISIAFALSGHQHAAQSGLYIIAQILGSIAAALVEGFLLPVTYHALRRCRLILFDIAHGFCLGRTVFATCDCRASTLATTSTPCHPAACRTSCTPVAGLAPSCGSSSCPRCS
jgi:glycerol uptake facilitator-like aquaporin